MPNKQLSCFAFHLTSMICVVDIPEGTHSWRDPETITSFSFFFFFYIYLWDRVSHAGLNAPEVTVQTRLAFHSKRSLPLFTDALIKSMYPQDSWYHQLLVEYSTVHCKALIKVNCASQCQLKMSSAIITYTW